jgi:catechol 2,3-dioxygenase-like lactoylglutathione lyase family enzyme
MAVSDLGRSVRFYRDTLGLRVSKAVIIEGDYPEKIFNVKGIKLEYAKMRHPGQSVRDEPVFELHCRKAPRFSPSRWRGHIAFTVKDIESEYRRLKKAGVKLISEPVQSPDGRVKICFAYDPDMNMIELMEDRKPGSAHTGGRKRLI